MLFRMQDTTVRVSVPVRDELRAIAEANNTTMDQALAMVLKRYRQFAIGESLVSWEASPADRAVLDAGASTVAGR
jgi:fructose-1,6-bisphosphatase/sedoheptulose 1,7-bisphosphatase-like protein